ncbi:MAG TPA: hypothetical protein VJ276_00845 [Thermoanaerobaculia bacterium]|nr:hypothetical protein [Thermoanaerobaculia bacterium]
MKVAAAVAVLVVAAAMLIWNARHPRPIVWDEANYEAQTIRDAELARSGGMVRLLKAFVFEDVERPPAYRVFAFPFTAMGVSLQGLRVLSIVFFVITCALLWSVAPRGVLLFALSPGVIAAFEWFGTDYPLLLACAMLLVAMCRPRLDFSLTALGVALGLLSKTSFLIFAASLLGARVLVEPWVVKRRVLIASAIGAVVAAPWWWWNAAPALKFANWSRVFPRLAVGQNALLVNLEHLLFGAIGLPAAFAIVILLWRRRRCPAAIPALAAAIALPLLALFSPWLHERHMAPATAALAFAVGCLAAEGRRLIAALALLGVQLLLILAGLAADPSRWPMPMAMIAASVMRKDNADWSFLRPYERVSFFGLAPSLSPPELSIPRVRAHEPAHVEWLWRMEDGPIDWARIEEKVRASDAVLVPDPATVHDAPLQGLSAHDRAIHNEHDARFVALVRSTGLFDESERRIENVNPYTLHVFIRRRG